MVSQMRRLLKDDLVLPGPKLGESNLWSQTPPVSSFIIHSCLNESGMEGPGKVDSQVKRGFISICKYTVQVHWNSCMVPSKKTSTFTKDTKSK